MNAEEHPFKPVFSNRIDLGHVLQSAVIIVMIGGGMFGMYTAVQGQIYAQGEINASQNQQLIELSRKIQQVQEDQRQSARDLATVLNKMTETLADLRVRIAESIPNARK